MKKQDILVQKAVEAIKNVFGDISVSKEETLVNLNTIKFELDLLIEVLEK